MGRLSQEILLFSLLLFSAGGFFQVAKSAVNDEDYQDLVHMIESPKEPTVTARMGADQLVQLSSQTLHVISKENMIKYYKSFNKAFDILREKMKALELDLDSNKCKSTHTLDNLHFH